MDEQPRFRQKPPRKVDRTLDEEALKKLSEAGKRSKPGTAEAMRQKWRELFIAGNPLREGEVYLSWINPRTGWRHAAIASDVEPIEYSRDGSTWKVAKKRNPSEG